MKRLLIAYALMTVLSWFLISGWSYADLYHTAQVRHYYEGDTPVSTPRHDAGFSCAYGTVAILWPVSLPLNYFATGFAQHGWRPVWDF